MSLDSNNPVYVTDRRLQEFGEQFWSNMKTWFLTNVDDSDYMSEIKRYLDDANRESIGTTATAKAQAILASINAMAQAFETAGISMSGVTTSQFATLIGSLSNNSGVFILDVNGVKWTAATWAYEKQVQGHDPAQLQGIILCNEAHDFLIAGSNQGQQMYGTYSHTVPNLEGMNGGIAGTPKDGTYNSRKTMAATNPDNCWDEYKLTYFEGMDYPDVNGKDVVFFPNEATLTSWANTMGLGNMLTLGDKIIYAYPHADYTEAQHYWVLKYHPLGVTSVQFRQWEAKVPYTDNYAVVGCRALELCMGYKEYEGDTAKWRLPSLFELMLIYLNKAAINECLIALDRPMLPSGQCWSCLQSTNNHQYSLSLADGFYYTTPKYNQYWVIPVAS